MNEKIENLKIRVKSHVEKHEKTYKIVGITATACGLLSGGYFLGSKQIVININPTGMLFGWKSTVKASNVVINEVVRKGHPGKIIENVTKGITFGSQNDASKFAGVSAATMAKHLRGELPAVKGDVYNYLRDAV